jgi:HSP20 family protein
MNNFMDQEQQTERRCRWMPATNISENDREYRVEMAVPGFGKEDFKISLEKNVLSISTERENEKKSEQTAEEQTELNYRMREFGKRNFCRSFSIPEAVDKDGIKAEYVNGILSITLPKKEEIKVKKEIQVK